MRSIRCPGQGPGLIALVLGSLVIVAACGGNVVVDPAVKPASTGGAPSSSSSSSSFSSSSVILTGVIGPLDGSTGFTVTGAGGSIVVGVGPSPTSVSITSASVTTGVTAGPCFTSCSSSLFSGGAPPCGGVALADYQALTTCGCTQSTCVVECGANFCMNGQQATQSCIACLSSSCQSAFDACQAN